MPCYLDFMSVFGLSKSARELRFSGFREQVLLQSSSPDLSVPGLGRSGRQIQLCYNLKGVARMGTGKNLQWSIRQAAIHHQFDVETGTALWIVTKGNLEIKERIEALTSKDGRPEDRAFETPAQCLKSSLAVHLLLCYWSIEDWRWYLQHLEDQVDHEVCKLDQNRNDVAQLTENSQTGMAVYGLRDRHETAREYTPTDLQNLQHYQDKINETIMVLEANNDVLSSLRNFYRTLQDDNAFTIQDACRRDIIPFAKQVDEMNHDSSMQIARAKLLIRITSDRKDLVS